MTGEGTVEDIVRSRLRSLRTTLGLSLDDVAERTHLSASTISRIETGKRTIGLDVLLPLARALSVDLDTLLSVQDDDDVILASGETGFTAFFAASTTSATAPVTALLTASATGAAAAVKLSFSLRTFLTFSHSERNTLTFYQSFET